MGGKSTANNNCFLFRPNGNNYMAIFCRIAVGFQTQTEACTMYIGIHTQDEPKSITLITVRGAQTPENRNGDIVFKSSMTSSVQIVYFLQKRSHSRILPYGDELSEIENDTDYKTWNPKYHRNLIATE